MVISFNHDTNVGNCFTYFRQHRIHPEAGWRASVVQRLFGGTSVPSVPFHSVHQTPQSTVVHARTGHMSRAVGPRAVVCQPGFCAILARNRTSIARRPGRLHKKIGHGKCICTLATHTYTRRLDRCIYISSRQNTYVNYFYNSGHTSILSYWTRPFEFDIIYFAILLEINEPM